MDVRLHDLRRALWLSGLSIGWNGVAGLLATYVSVVTGNLSLLGFGVDAVIDSAASVVLIWRFLAEARDPVRAIRVERIAELVVGLALIALALYLAIGALRALSTGAHPAGTLTTIALLVASTVALPPLALAKYGTAARLGSAALRADSILTAVAALLAAISMASLVAAQALGIWWADALAAIVVASIVLREGWQSTGLPTRTLKERPDTRE